MIDEVSTGRTVCRPYRLKNISSDVAKAVRELEKILLDVYPSLPNARWVALRLLDGDPRITRAIDNDEFADFGGGIKDLPDSPLNLELGIAS